MNRGRQTGWTAVSAAMLLVGSIFCCVGQETNGPPLPSPLTVEGALRFAWFEHPAMKRARLKLESAGDLRAIGTLWPDPTIGAGAGVEVDARSTVGVSLSQAFELGGKRRARVDVAEARSVLAEAGVLDAWLSIRAGVHKAFARLRFASRTETLAKERRALEEERSALQGALFKSGKMPEHDALAARSAMHDAASRARQAAYSMREAERRLLAAVGGGGTQDRVEWVAPTGSVSVVSRDFAELVQRARDGNASLLTARARRAVAEAKIDLARAARWSDVTIGLEGRLIEFEDGGDTEGYALAVRSPLPLRNRRREDLDVAERAVDIAGNDHAAMRAEIESELAGLLAAYQRSVEEHGTLVDKQIPLAERLVVLAESLYRAGRSSRLEPIEEQLDLVALQSEQARLEWLASMAAIGLDRVASVPDP